MKLKLTGVIILFAILITGCTDTFISTVDLDHNWLRQVSANDKIILHYRPDEVTGDSPDQEVVDTILANQEIYYNEIQDKLKISFSDRISIYLFNHDEALEKIGTNGGGHAISETLAIYYTYFPVDGGIFDQNWDQARYIGPHEMVHLITHRVLGKPGTRLLSEGYAVALDGSYGLTKNSAGSGVRTKTITEWMKGYYNQDKILTPTEMLTDEGLAEQIFYPNSGYLLEYLFNKYGVVKINRLFSLNAREVKDKFQEITGTSFTEMETDYLAYCQEKLKIGEN